MVNIINSYKKKIAQSYSYYLFYDICFNEDKYFDFSVLEMLFLSFGFWCKSTVTVLLQNVWLEGQIWQSNEYLIRLVHLTS